MTNSESQAAIQPDLQQLLELRFNSTDFRLLDTTDQPVDLSPVTALFADQLLDLGFVFSHELSVTQSIGKAPDTISRVLVYLNASRKAYAILTDLYHEKIWVYFTHYFTRDRRIITTCQPGTIPLGSQSELSDSSGIHLENTGSCTLPTQWKKHQHQLASLFPDESPLLMDPNQHLDAERQAYRKYTESLLASNVLRQSDTQLLGFTQTGANGYLAAVTSKSAKRPKPRIAALVGKSDKIGRRLNHRDVALFASAAVFSLIVFNLFSHLKPSQPEATSSSVAVDTYEENEELPETLLSSIKLTTPTLEPLIQNTPTADTNAKPEQFVVASEEDEMWRIAVENAEFYLMSNDGDPAPWIRTARKMAAGFEGDDPRIARTYFLAALLEKDGRVAEQQYNRALSIQTKTLGLYHAETAQTLEALAWVAEGTHDNLEEAITHQKLALNVYRSIFGEEAEDTRAARWKLQYFEDRLAGRRPRSDDNRRLLPALAKFAR